MVKSITPLFIVVILMGSTVALATSLSISGVQILGSFTYSAIWATVDFDPDKLNLKSKGKWITVYMELPEGYDVRDIDVSSIMLNGEVPAELHPAKVDDYDGDGTEDLMVKFDRARVQSTLSPGIQTITITGTILGTVPDFLGTDKIEVIDDG